MLKKSKMILCRWYQEYLWTYILEGYSAEQISLNMRDEILSAMTVYGFLSYHDETLTIPNKELRMKCSGQ